MHLPTSTHNAHTWRSTLCRAMFTIVSCGPPDSMATAPPTVGAIHRSSQSGASRASTSGCMVTRKVSLAWSAGRVVVPKRVVGNSSRLVAMWRVIVVGARRAELLAKTAFHRVYIGRRPFSGMPTSQAESQPAPDLSERPQLAVRRANKSLGDQPESTFRVRRSRS